MKQKYTADDIKKIYEKNLPKVPKAPYREPVTVKREDLRQPIKQTTQPENDNFINNITQPFKNIQSNYVVGNLGEKESKAWSAYRAKQDAETLKAAQKATAEREKYVRDNQNVGQGNIVTKDFAQYLPQMKNQIVSGFSGAGNNAWKGAGVGAGAALIAGQMGPQVLAPEEMVTVPAGAVAGAVMGGKAGYVEGVAKYSYNQMAGSAYKGLLDLGVPNDIALKVSGDEALISSLIEAAGAGVDIATVGISKLFSKGTKDAATKVAKNRLVSALKAYGVNIASEALEEGSQELVSIQSEKRALEMADMPKRDITWEEDLERILESARGGAAIATVSGGLNAAGNVAVNTMYNRQIRNSLPKQETQQNVQKPTGKIKVEDIVRQNQDVMQEINPQNVNQQVVQQQLPKQPKIDNTKLPTVNANKQVDQTIDNVINFAQNANSDVTGQIEQIDTQNIENVVNTNTQQTKISPKYRNKFVKSVTDALGVSKYSDKAGVNSLTDMMIDQIVTDGDIDSQSVDTLFDTMMNEGIYTDNEFYKQYKDLKNEIRGTRLYVGDNIKSDFAKGEYNNFKKAHFGKLNLTSDRNDMSVDQYYQELNERYPELFPESIIAPQDQLGKIADVQNSIVKNEERLISFVQSNEEYKQFARQEFNNAIENLKAEVKKTATRKLPVKNEQIVDVGNKNAQNLNSEVEGQNALPTKEKKSGILIDESSEQYRKKSPHEYKYIDRLSKSVGIKVKFVPDLAFDVKLEDGTIQRNEANGYYDSEANTIVIAQDASNPVMVVAKHELTHLMQDRNPSLYKQYKEYVISSMKKKGTYQAEIDKLSKSYEGVLNKSDIKSIEDEIVSNASAAYLEGDRQSIQEIIDYNPSMAAKVHEFIRDVIDKIKTALGKDTGTMNVSQFRKAEKLWAEMLDETIKENDARIEAKTEQSDKGSKLSIKDLVFDDEIAGYTKERIDTIFDKYGAKSTPKYSKAYIAYMSPDEFLSLSTTNIERIESQSRKLDIEQLRDEYQDIFLQFDQDTNEITGHEGRHRMVALRNEGIKQVPVVFIPDGEKGRYNRSKIDNIRFEGQEFRNGRAPGIAEVKNMIPVSAEYKNELDSTFVRDRGIQFSLKDNQGRELTKEQQNYFKDSKVKDSKGNLLTMYHGTPRGGITQFNSGTYFTENKEYADVYQSPNASSISVKQGEITPKTYEVYLNIKKPFDTRNKKERDIFNKEYYRKYGTGTPLMESGLPDWVDGMDLQEFIEEQGYDYDGLILDEGATGGYGEEVKSRGISYVVFDSNQVKNIDNKNPTSNDDIRLSLKETDKQPDLKPQKKDVKATMVNSGKKLSTKSQENIINEAAKRIQEAREIVDIDEDIADVLTSSKQKKLPRKNAAKNSVDAFKRKFIDSGNTVATVAKIAKDSALYTIYNNARQSRQAAEFMIGAAQTDVVGNVVGESLKDIFDPIRKKGDDYYKKFSEYMFHMHNIDRMAQGKPVFGESITAEISKMKVEELESSNPEFIKYAARIYKYNNNLMQYRIDTGLVSVEQANIMAEMYPNYIPTYRRNAVSSGARANGGRVEITQGIKKAKGSNKDLLPLHEQMARQTMQTVQAGKRNLFGNRLLSDVLINRDKLSEYVQSIETEKVDIDIDTDEITVPELKNAFVIYTNGEKTTMKVNPGVFEGVKAISSEGREITSVEKFAKSANSMFKKLVTAYNPMFTIKNVARDIQDAGLYTKDLKAFTKNYPKAWKEITTNGRRWQQYQALGGFGSSVFDYEKGYKQEVRDTGAKKFAGFVKDNTIERVEALNFWTEQAPRFAEFLATLEKGDGSYENLMEAMYNSADVTVNFGRSGSWGKTINSTFVPFFNPAVQGTSKLIRQFTETKGVKNWTKLVIKVTALGIAPSVINALLYDDDEEYENIHDRDKDVNFLFKIGEDQWVKIPKGRVLSAKGEENAWAGFISTAIDNTLPMNPLENNIYSPIQAVKSNTTWYGTPIEGQGLQGFKPGERYDTRTDSFSRWLGKRLNYSPKKINYLLDAYTGVIGDFVLPKMSQKAETNAFKKQFVLDSTMSNKISTTFYRKIDDLTYEKNSIEEANVNDVVYRFMNKQRTAASDLYREIKAIEKSNVSDDEKRVKVKEITAIINGIQLNALNVLEEYEKAAERNFKKYDNDVDNAYLYTNKEVFGAEYALQVYNKNIYQKYLESGQSAEEYFTEYFDELFAKREARAAKETSTDTKIKLPTIKTKTAGTKLPKIKNK